MNIKRSCGILMPVFSLPSRYGIGTLGKTAYDFIDFLADAGQSWWQMLPAGPTGCGDSPYQSFSSYAGNPYFIDLDMLAEDGLLTPEELCGADTEECGYIDYGKLFDTRFDILRLAVGRGTEKFKMEFSDFCEENMTWLVDYSLYMALKKHFNMREWTQWPEDIRMRHPDALARYSKQLRDDIEFYRFLQFLFFRQWNDLRAYARKKGIGIIGDMPIYVALDSCDVWASPEYFRLDEKNIPIEVAGVPPDYFSAEGQLWGNPLYDWDKMREDGYGWWIRRVDGASKLYDVLRIDHFRGFESYWAVPFGADTAKSGRWCPGPGMDLVGRLTSWFGNVSFIAEDLGILTPEVHSLLSESGLPGMKVLEFAFDPEGDSDYLPHRYERLCVCYTGTHDNAPLSGWLEDADPEELAFAREYLGTDDLADGILRSGMSSVSTLFIAQMQDWLGLGNPARINTPGTAFGNWRWRLGEGMLTPELAERLRRMTALYGRCGK